MNELLYLLLGASVWIALTFWVFFFLNIRKEKKAEDKASKIISEAEKKSEELLKKSEKEASEVMKKAEIRLLEKE